MTNAAAREVRSVPQLFRGPRPYVSEASFTVLLMSLRASGGVLTGDGVVLLLRDYRDQPLSWLARAIVRREIVHIMWRSQVMVPMFQFRPEDMALREGMQSVLATLAPVYDDWEIARWFGEPNVWLRGKSPAACVSLDARGVHDAARADSFIAGGD
ncbi:hypothetical protein SNE35_31460 [Paucibacter sp. R3-3]|uniref:Antitoxin Xre/MbcA/ParS-like toxin-binding domain-containing protein n=2 Tax=Roseateles agri TaxID=3098619 RepID=A0ABU5DRW1_9BURK|nr:hypothetical protein [Paucibacter sp. R3-3]